MSSLWKTLEMESWSRGFLYDQYRDWCVSMKQTPLSKEALQDFYNMMERECIRDFGR